MKQDTLIGMVEFVKLQIQRIIDCEITHIRSHNEIVKYANFLSQTPEIWMFVPAKFENGVWAVLEAPRSYSDNRTAKADLYSEQYKKEYTDAKERCLFEGFEVYETEFFNKDLPKSICIYDVIHPLWWHKDTMSWHLSRDIKTIEDLCKYNLTLSPTAKKELGWE